MRIVNQLDEAYQLFRAARTDGGVCGLVPTMGALHEGHLRLVEKGRSECDLLAVSIFVNAMQFNDKGDHERYPRTVQEDLDLLAARGVDMVILPSDQEMHPEPIQFQVVPSGLSEGLEGASRPGHFAGVATVVMKLFHILSEGRAYFGEKDFQQLAVIKRMVVEFHLPIEVVGVAIVREPDGLAMSSRNRLLSEQERAAAPALYKSIEALRRGYSTGERRVQNLIQLAKDELAREPLFKLDYLEVVNPATLDLLEFADDDSRIVMAANIGRVRLIDNSPVGAQDAEER